MNILKMADENKVTPNMNWAILENEDGDIARLSWDELKLDENGIEYDYFNDAITDESIGNEAFSDCISLLSIQIPDTVKSIGIEAFDYCDNLTSIIIPNSVEVIDWYAFDHCEKLTSITISNSLKEIGGEAFRGCPLTEIKYKGQVFSSKRAFFRYFKKNHD